MLKIAIDYWETISQSPDTYREFAEACESNGIPIYIVSAVGERDANRILNEINSLTIPNTVISIIICSGEEVVEEKLKYAQENKIGMFIDNRLDVCQELRKHGIIALQAILP